MHKSSEHACCFRRTPGRRAIVEGVVLRFTSGWRVLVARADIRDAQTLACIFSHLELARPELSARNPAPKIINKSVAQGDQAEQSEMIPKFWGLCIA